jgi:hypothetical protein
LALAVAVAVALLWVVVVEAPPWFVDDRSLEGRKVQNDVRGTLLQGLAGLALLVGLFLTYRQLVTSREGQITERYTRAIEQLGSEQLDVRLGGIYALERIARDSQRDERTISEVLSAFVRNHSPWPPTQAGQYRADAPFDDVPDLYARAPDIAACLTVLGRASRPAGESGRMLDLTAADLRKAELIGANLDNVNFHESNLTGAFLVDASLRGSNLINTVVVGTLFMGAQLQGSHLAGVDLSDADLTGADLQGASADQDTRWPDDFDRIAAEVKLARYYGDDSTTA